MTYFVVYHSERFNKYSSDMWLRNFSKSDPQNFILFMEYDGVANVRADSLDEVFMLTQHGESQWWNHDKVDLRVTADQRSTSVGDIILNLSTRETFIVEFSGFRKLGD